MSGPRARGQAARLGQAPLFAKCGSIRFAMRVGMFRPGHNQEQFAGRRVLLVCRDLTQSTFPRPQLSRELGPFPFGELADDSPELRGIDAHSLSVIRIRPSPVTTGPLAVTVT